MNCKVFREENLLQKFIQLLNTYTFVVAQDQDYLNIICKDQVLWLDASWNTEVFGELPCKEEDIQSIELYVKPEENTAYYVINGDVTGSFFI